MAKISAIEWTDATWNPWTGCHKISPGCKNCYMFEWARRYGRDPNDPIRSKDATFYAPLRWKEPRRIFTCSLSDFFIEEADPWRYEAWSIMARTPWHTYQVLTKRPDRMLTFIRQWADLEGESATPQLVRGPDAVRQYHPSGRGRLFADHLESLGDPPPGAAYPTFDWAEGSRWLPTILPNVWLGVSVEDQKTADERIPLLLQTPAAVRFLSMEPLLGPVDIGSWLIGGCVCGHPEAAHMKGELKCWIGQRCPCTGFRPLNTIDWVIVGGESGPHARPMHPDWVRSIRDQCTAAGVPFFFKQWGEYRSIGVGSDEHATEPIRMGKKKAGRYLDGREWNEMPEVAR